jgi:hypothetical protein
MATPTISPGQIKTGPGRILYKYGLTAMPAVTAAGSKTVYDWTTNTWLEVGATAEGLTYTESTDTSDVTVAESLYPIRTVTTGKTGRVAFSMSHISDVNWKLAMNGGTLTVSGAGATKLSSYVPPLMGAEVRVALGFHSLDEEELIVWPQVFNVGSVETARASLETKGLLPVEFNVELPDPTVLTTPYKRWTAGSLAQGT